MQSLGPSGGMVDAVPSGSAADSRTQDAQRNQLGPSGGMVDAGDSKSPAARRAGSSPALGTKTEQRR